MLDLRGLIALLVAGLGLCAANANAAHYRYGACSQHAKLMLYACFADRADDYLVHRADCAYVTAAEDERECLLDARAERAEKADECNEVYAARLDLCDLVGERRYDIAFEPEDFVDPNDIGDSVDPNQYWPLTAGHTHVIVAESEDDDGEMVREVVVVTATEEVRDVGGLPCRVIRDLVFEEEEEGEYSALEVTQDWYGQIGAAGAARGIGELGDTVYCGENTFEVEDDLVDNTDGSFAHDTDRAKAGFLVRQNPAVGTGDRQEMFSDEAEDYVRYEALMASPSDEEGGDVEGALACDGGCLKTYELNPREPDGAEHKYYLPGIGFVLATKLDEDGVPTGEREEVTCVTSSLTDALDMGEACGINDADALRDAMCAGSPEAEWLPEDLCDGGD
ncbi:MAG: hypothetical protein AB7I04_19105 [Pseudomonadales bacterium]